MASPFNLQDDQYFQKLEDKLNRIPTWNVPQMDIPEDYFPQLEERILSQTIHPSQRKGKIMWLPWLTSAAAALANFLGLWMYQTPQDHWSGVTNADILVYMEEHQSTALPVDEMAGQFDAQNWLPLDEITEKDVQEYEEIYGI